MKLDLDDREVDYIAQVLAHRPWVEVNGLLVKIQQQANDPANRPGAEQSVPLPAPAEPS